MLMQGRCTARNRARVVSRIFELLGKDSIPSCVLKAARTFAALTPPALARRRLIYGFVRGLLRGHSWTPAPTFGRFIGVGELNQQPRICEFHGLRRELFRDLLGRRKNACDASSQLTDFF